MKRYFFYFLMLPVLLMVGSCGDSELLSPSFDAPANLVVEKIDEGRVRLTWTYNPQSAQVYYVIGRKEGVGAWDENYGQTQSDLREFIDEIPTNSYTVFSYKVKAVEVDTENESYFSNPASFFPDVTKPSELTVSQLNESELILTWNDNVIGEVGYKIDKKIDDNNWVVGYATLPENAEIFIDQISELYTVISYRVYAYVGATNSPFEAISFTPTVSPPYNLGIEQLTQNQVKLTWDYSGEQHTGFQIDRMIGVSDWVYLNSTDSGVRSYIDSIDIDSGTIAYRVRAAASDTLFSSYSEPASINLNIKLISSLSLAQPGNKLCVYENYVIIANDFNGVLIVDVSNQLNPGVAGSISIPGRTLSVYAYDGKLFATNHNGGLYIYSLQNPSNPLMLHYVETLDVSYDVVVGRIAGKDYAFVADGMAGLLIIDLENNVTGYPVIASRVNTQGISFSVEKEDSILYLADGTGGLKQIDASNPYNPFVINQKTNLGQVLDVKVKDQLIYLANANYGLRILDKNTLNQITYYDTKGYTKSIFLTNRYGYLADRENGLEIVNVLNSDELFTIANISTESNANDITVKNSYAYLLTETMLHIIQINP